MCGSLAIKTTPSKQKKSEFILLRPLRNVISVDRIVYLKFDRHKAATEFE